MDLRNNNNSFALIEKIKTNLLYGDIHIFPDAKLTICIPTYKRPEALKEAIKSSLFQSSSITNYYVAIIDNDDSDSNEIIELVKSFNDNRLLYFKNEKR